MTILIGVDFSPASGKTLDAVRGMFPREDLKVIVLHVAEPNPAFVGWEAGPGVVRDQMAETFRHERREVEQMAASLREHGIEAVGLTVQGAIVATILAEVERLGADLVAVGSHGHGAAYDLAVGSISAGVIRKSTRPVLVVPDHR
jgi:nucleotide-binding universal stress UspA family protein